MAVTAGVLAEDVKATLRTIQFWTDSGVLLVDPASDRQGKGKHRSYDEFERVAVRAAAEMARLKIPVGTMRQITAHLRGDIGRIRVSDAMKAPVVILFTLRPNNEFSTFQLSFDSVPEPHLFDPNDLGIPTEGDLPVTLYEAVEGKLSGEFLVNSKSGFLLNLWALLADLRTGK